jgi:V/A-type H+-transporting ATPase subunit C
MIKILFHNLPDDTRYAFAVARIRALESRMLDHALIARMLRASGIDELLKIMIDTEYGIILNEAADTPFESTLDSELHRIYMLIHSIDPNPEWTDLWRWRYDAHNLKVILKAGSSNKEALEHLITHSVLDPQKMIREIDQGDYSSLPPPFKEAVERVLTEDMENEKGGNEIDFIIDRALLRSFLRIKGFKSTDNLFSSSFIPGGYISENRFFPHEEKRSEEIVYTIIENSPYAELKPFLDSRNPAAIEAGTDNFIIAYLRQTRQRAFGVEPLIGYMLAKEIEIKNLRILYLSKANALEEGLIKERLRETYV